MKAATNTTQLMSAARELEEASRLSEAAGLYQQVVNADPTNQQAVSRLLTLYRRLKEPKKELAVIQSALAAYAQKDKASQQKWLSAHPQAAKASRAFLRSLGGSDVSSFGANAQVQRLQKRKAIVEKKLTGKAAPKPATQKPIAPKPAAKKSTAERKTEAAVARKAAAAARKSAAAAAKEKRAEERRLSAEQRKHETQQKKAEAAAAKKAATAERQAAEAARKEAARKAAEAATPSLFVISLRYLAPLETIDAMLPKHAAFLDKHFAAGDFLVAGRQIPRTGGIIIARGKDRTYVERIMKQDPFLKNKLATVDIVEFAASKLNKKQWQQIG